ncbi:MAG: DUF3768 domain-containing protein [Caulobacter sp.]|nr:DUF3768 domain-containing protein [Caulobacter sp.]
MTTPSIAIRHRVRDLNDAFRLTITTDAGRWFFTRGVLEKGPEFSAQAASVVKHFDAFTPDNDPYGEHDFGSFNLAGEHLFWKIDYYDRTMCSASPNPAEPSVTCRVLTVMLASEY